jgi:integrase
MSAAAKIARSPNYRFACTTAKSLECCEAANHSYSNKPHIGYGGLRCPSEHLELRWRDIDWTAGKMLVHSPKTEHHEGGESRIVPLFAEMRPYLEDAFDPEAEFVINRYRRPDANMRTTFLKIIKRAGVKP